MCYYYFINASFIDTNSKFSYFQFFAVIIYACISGKGYIEENGKEVCLYDNNSGACGYGSGISVIAILASIGFLVGEYLFEQMSSVKTRKHYVLGDLGYVRLQSHNYGK